MHVEVTPVKLEELAKYHSTAERSDKIAARVVKAREIQAERFKHIKGLYCNAQMPSKMVREVCRINDEGTTTLKNAMERFKLSARAFDRILKVARTAADLENCIDIQSHHLAEAIQFRSLDRENWAG